VYGVMYRWIAVGVLALVAMAVAFRMLNRRDAFIACAAWVQLYAIMAIADYFAPGGILHPKLQLMGYLPDRASLYTVVLLCAVLASIKVEHWQVVGFSALAVVFFLALYIDEGKLDRKEQQITEAVATLPQGSRVVGTFYPTEGTRIHEQHAIDRACVGHCFVVSNYEPSSGQFRIKASPGNRIVASAQPVARSFETGTYQVQPEDLPLVDIYPCGQSLVDICILKLQAGEFVGRAALQERFGHQSFK
jgi:hypothetical protein